MLHVSIFEKKWLDLVFEGKNQQYGAYQLRLESAKTTFFAFIFGIGFLVGAIVLLSSFNTKPKEIIITCTLPRASHVNPVVPKTEPKKPEVKKTEAKAPSAKPLTPNAPLVVVETHQAQTSVPINAETPKNSGSNSSIGTGISSDLPTNHDSGGLSILPTPVEGPVNSKELDRQPMFPGGIKNFCEYVGSHFERQEMEEGETVRVLVSFVIEKNGTMTDIEIINKTTPVIDNEALRVLTSLKTKWSPGYKDGAPVRTRFTMPITVTSE
jgi:protein TonB